MMRVAEALAMARRMNVDRSDAQALLSHRLGRPRSWLIAHDDASLEPADEAAFRLQLQRRADGVPLAYIVGHREFRGLELIVTPAVLVPRPETEGLVDWALECMSGRSAPRVVDLGTGSGAIAVALASARTDAQVTAVDCSVAALDVARANAARHRVDLRLHQGDWWQAVAACSFDVAVANPPYIAERDPHLAALTHEPAGALISGAEGLDALRKVTSGARRHLTTGGWLLLEHGFDQGAAVRKLLSDAGFIDVATRLDLAGLDRCSGGRQPTEATLL